MAVKAKPSILDITPYKPGKSKVSYKGRVIKLSSNENALGTSKKAIKAYKDCHKKLHLYPDGGHNNLRSAISEKYNLNSNNIVCGAGSDEIIALLSQSFLDTGDEIICSEHGFLMYPICAKQCGAKNYLCQRSYFKTRCE